MTPVPGIIKILCRYGLTPINIAGFWYQRLCHPGDCEFLRYGIGRFKSLLLRGNETVPGVVGFMTQDNYPITSLSFQDFQSFYNNFLPGPSFWREGMGARGPRILPFTAGGGSASRSLTKKVFSTEPRASLSTSITP